MRDEQILNVAAAGLVIGALFGMAGTFAPTAELRGLAWGTDGIALVVASALLALHHLRKGDVHLSAGFLVFLAGETLIVSGSAMDVAASAPSFSYAFAPAVGSVTLNSIFPSVSGSWPSLRNSGSHRGSSRMLSNSDSTAMMERPGSL